MYRNFSRWMINMTVLEIKEVRLNTFSAYFVLPSLVIKPKIHFIRPKNFGIPHASPLLPRFTSKLLLRRLIYIDDNSVLRLPFVPSHPCPSSPLRNSLDFTKRTLTGTKGTESIKKENETPSTHEKNEVSRVYRESRAFAWLLRPTHKFFSGS